MNDIDTNQTSHRPGFMKTWNPQPGIRQLFDCPVVLVDISSRVPDDIIYEIQQQDLRHVKVLALVNQDTWRYGDDYHLQRFLSSLDQQIYIFHWGYLSRKVIENVHEISWPYVWFDRVNTFNLPSVPDLSAARSYGFACLNNRMSLQRLLLGMSLYAAEQLPHMIFSQNRSSQNLIQGFDKVILDRMPDWDQYRSILPISWDRKPLLNLLDYRNYDFSPDHHAFTECYGYIVTETDSEKFYPPGVAHNLPICTEKTFIPFVTGQVPIFLAARGHLDFLKGLGFEVMENLVGTDFDQMGTFAKIKKIVEIVCKGRDYIESFYHDNLQQIKHNHSLLYTNQVEDLILSRVQTIIGETLKS